jgi:4-amino-4-deoxy-L-arabinose transferase-like glycosyltransferase
MTTARAAAKFRPSRREWRFALLVVSAAAVGWVSFVFVTGDYPPVSDQREYDVVGERFAAGLGLTYPNGTLYVHSHPPLYPVFLGAIYAAGGGAYAVRAAQLALALATLVLAYLTARRFFGLRVARASLVAGALYLPTAFYASQLYSEILFTFLLVAAAYLFLLAWERRRGLGSCFAAGALFGAAGLTRGVALAAALAFAGYLLLRRGPSVGRRAAKAGALALGVAAAVAPWSVYVYRQTGHAVLVDTKSAVIFYLGNCESTPAHHAWDIIDVGGGPRTPANAAAAEDRFEASGQYTSAALRYIVGHPGRTALRFVSKFADMWEVDRMFAADYHAGYLPGARKPLIFVYLAAELAASAAALAAFWVALVLMPGGAWRNVALVVTLATASAYAATLSHPHYHYPLMVLGAPALGYFFAEVIPGLRARAFSRRRLALAAAAAAALVIIWFRMAWLYVAHGS